MREFIQRRNFWSFCLFSLLNSIVFIDNSVRSRLFCIFPSIRSKESYLIPNLIMRFPSSSDCSNLFDSSSLHNKFIFSFIGRLDDPSKGFDFVFHSFLVFAKSNSTSILLVFSSCDDATESRYLSILDCENLSDRVYFLGEVPSLLQKGYYNHLSCIIRGESAYRPGRSVLEALFHNCFAIIPGNSSDVTNDPSLNTFTQSIIPYAPRNMKSLIDALKCASIARLNHVDDLLPDIESNSVSYIQSFKKAYRFF